MPTGRSSTRRRARHPRAGGGRVEASRSCSSGTGRLSRRSRRCCGRSSPSAPWSSSHRRFWASSSRVARCARSSGCGERSTTSRVPSSTGGSPRGAPTSSAASPARSTGCSPVPSGPPPSSITSSPMHRTSCARPSPRCRVTPGSSFAPSTRPTSSRRASPPRSLLPSHAGSPPRSPSCSRSPKAAGPTGPSSPCGWTWPLAMPATRCARSTTGVRSIRSSPRSPFTGMRGGSASSSGSLSTTP